MLGARSWYIDVVVDQLFADPSLASWYHVFCVWDRRDDFGFYLPLVMSARSVLDCPGA